MSGYQVEVMSLEGLEDGMENLFQGSYIGSGFRRERFVIGKVRSMPE